MQYYVWSWLTNYIADINWLLHVRLFRLLFSSQWSQRDSDQEVKVSDEDRYSKQQPHEHTLQRSETIAPVGSEV